MTLEQTVELSFYQEITELCDNKKVVLVKHVDSGKLYVKKSMNLYNYEIYQKLMRLNLSNVPKIFFCIEDDKELIVIEEYIHGNTLKEMIHDRSKLDEQEAAQIILALCTVLNQLHSCNPAIIHRDIKPSNIMVSNDGVVKLIDFNAAKEYSDGKNEDTFLIGTKKYAAPEQYGFGQSDSRTDIYAIGMVFNEILIGYVSRVNVYKGEFRNIIEKCIKLDVDQRYQCVEDLMNDINNLNGSHAETIEQQVQTAQDRVESKRGYLPVGFRTRTPWKMIVAFIGYLFILWLGFTMKITDDGVDVTSTYRIVLNRIAVTILCLGTVFFCGDYRNCRTRLPRMNKKRKNRLLLEFGYWFAFAYIDIMIMTILGG